MENPVIAVELTGRWVRLELLAEDHREPLRLAADDDHIWEHMTILARGPGFDDWFDTALRQHRDNKRVPWAVAGSRMRP